MIRILSLDFSRDPSTLRFHSGSNTERSRMCSRDPELVEGQIFFLSYPRVSALDLRKSALKSFSMSTKIIKYKNENSSSIFI